MKPVGLFAGRFQPLHYGHMSIIEQIDDECEKIIIVIGSAQISHTPNNPFTAGERYEMINETLKKSDIKHEYCIIPVQDINRYDLWVKHVQSLCPPFTVVYACSPFIQRLFLEAGCEVVNPKILSHPDREERLSATTMRQGITANGLRYLDIAPIPTPAKEIIKRIDGVKRIQLISRGD